MKNYYRILEINPDATQSEIKAAYYTQSLIYHPDKCGSDVQFKLVSEAYSALSDPLKRAQYDEAWEIYQATGNSGETIKPSGALGHYSPPYSEHIRQLYQAQLNAYKISPLKKRDKNSGFKDYPLGYYKQQGRKETYVYDNIYEFVADKSIRFRKTHNTVLPDQLMPDTAIKLLIHFLEGKHYGAALSKIIDYLSKHINDLNHTSRQPAELTLYMGVHMIMSMTIDDLDGLQLLNAFEHIQSYAELEHSVARSFLLPLYENSDFRQLFSYALHLYWQSDSPTLGTPLLQDLNNNSDIHQLQAKYASEMGSDRGDFVKIRLRLLNLMSKMNSVVSKKLQEASTADELSEIAFYMLDWFPAIASLSPNEIHAHFLLHVGLFFQYASQQSPNVATRMANEFVALDCYDGAMHIAQKKGARLELYVGVHILHMLNQCQYDTNKVSSMIHVFQNRVGYLAQTLPISQKLGNIKPFLVQIDLNILFIKELLNQLQKSTQEKLTRQTALLPNANDIATFYLAYEAYLQNWFVETQNPTVELQLRNQLMWALLAQKKRNFIDIEQHLSEPWIMIDRDPNGWIRNSASLKFPSGTQAYRSFRGFSIEISTNSLWLPDYDRLHYSTEKVLSLFAYPWQPATLSRPADPEYERLLTLLDVKELFVRSLSKFSFSLDPPQDGLEMRYHPFQQMRISPTSAYNSKLYTTALLADYLLKELTVGTEIQGYHPFQMRSLSRLLEPLPEHLKAIIQKFHDTQSGDNKLHRFWIEANDLSAAIDEQHDERYSLKRLSVSISEPSMRIKKHLMTRDRDGNLVDTDEADEGHPFYIINSRQEPKLKNEKKYKELGIQSPALVLIKNTNRIYVMGQFGSSTAYTVPEDVDLERLLTFSRDKQNKVSPDKAGSDYYYHTICALTQALGQPHMFTPEYVFAHEMTEHYDEFSKHFPELGRLKAFSTVTAMVRSLFEARHIIKEKISSIENRLKDTDFWTKQRKILCAKKEIRKPVQTDLDRIISGYKKLISDEKRLYEIYLFTLVCGFEIQYESNSVIICFSTEYEKRRLGVFAEYIRAKIKFYKPRPKPFIPAFPYLEAKDLNEYTPDEVPRTLLKNFQDQAMKNYDKIPTIGTWHNISSHDGYFYVRPYGRKENTHLELPRLLLKHKVLHLLFQNYPTCDKNDLKCVLFNEWGATFAYWRILKHLIMDQAQKITLDQQGTISLQRDRLHNTIEALDRLKYPENLPEQDLSSESLWVPAAVRHGHEDSVAYMAYGGVNITPTIHVSPPDDPGHEALINQTKDATRVVLTEERAGNSSIDILKDVIKTPQKRAEACRSEVKEAVKQAASDPTTKNHSLYRQKLSAYEKAEESVQWHKNNLATDVEREREASRRTFLNKRRVSQGLPTAHPDSYPGTSPFGLFGGSRSQQHTQASASARTAYEDQSDEELEELDNPYDLMYDERTAGKKKQAGTRNLGKTSASRRKGKEPRNTASGGDRGDGGNSSGSDDGAANDGSRSSPPVGFWSEGTKSANTLHARRKNAANVRTNKDKGNLGEDTSDEALLRVGYQRLPSKLPRNQGIDGVFIKYSADGKPFDILIVESKFSSTGSYKLGDTKKGRQLSTTWIYATLEKMVGSQDPTVRETARTIRRYIPEKIVRVKLNMLNPKGINRWNTYDSYVLQPRGASFK